jgi:EAL domain-containing protein (putative c-di-GMP-specific phosphodiesterase class I)
VWSSRFIPVAEATGLILPLSDWGLETACRQIAAWEPGGRPDPSSFDPSGHPMKHLKISSQLAIGFGLVLPPACEAVC